MTEYEESDEPVLSEEDREFLIKAMKDMEVLIESTREPMDSKVLGLLEIAHDMLFEQIELDKFYTWGPALEVEHASTHQPEGKKFLFIKEEEEPPSAEELENWFK